MFLENSRYVAVPTTEATISDGRTVTALKLRVLPATTGGPYLVKDNDQLDVLAHRTTNDGTKFWHIADANTELEATKLIAETNATILVPKT